MVCNGGVGYQENGSAIDWMLDGNYKIMRYVKGLFGKVIDLEMIRYSWKQINWNVLL